MAKSLDERLSGALCNDRARDHDLKALIAEAGEKRKCQLAIADAAEAESYDPALSAEDREAAAGKAERAHRAVRMYEEAVATLEQKLATRQSTEKRLAAEGEKAAILSERDELAARFAKIVPECVDKLTAIFAEVDANTERMRAARLSEPNAEAMARGVPGSWFVDHAEVRRFTQMSIPAWSDAGRCWPPGEGKSALDDFERHLKGIKRQTRTRQAEREAATWGWYRLYPVGGRGISFGYRLRPSDATKTRSLYRQPWCGEIAHAEAKRLLSEGVKVEALTEAEAKAWISAREAEEAEKEAASGFYFPERR